jgi:hypothetical protein
MQYAMQCTYQIQGNEILLQGDPYLAARISQYLGLLYQGETARGAKPLKFDVHLADKHPCVPPEAVKVIQGPHAFSYNCGEKTLFVSRSGSSMISLNLAKNEAEGFFDRKFSEDLSKFFSLLGFTITEILKYQGLYFLHGACVYGCGRAYLFSGSSGTGKTTAAFNLVRQGFQFVADDSLFFSLRRGEIVVTPYYTNFHVDKSIVIRCPEISGAKELKDSPRGFTRMRVDMSRTYPGSFVSSLMPERIIFPRISPSWESSFSPLNQMEVYKRLLKQTILAADTEILRNQLQALEKLTKQIKGFELITGKDMHENPKILPILLNQMEN